MIKQKDKLSKNLLKEFFEPSNDKFQKAML